MNADPSMTAADNPPPLWAHNARHSDPATSHEAADKSAKASAASINVVRMILADGIARTDEEIHAEAVKRGVTWTDGTTRHGRRHLENIGDVVDSELRGVTRAGSPAIRWKKA